MSISGRLMIGNVYGQRAYDQMESWRPAELAEIPDPQAHFRRLGVDVEAEIIRRTGQLAGQPPAGESYLERTGRLGRARFEAEGQVLAERVLVGPEPGHPQYDPQDDPDLEPTRFPADGPWLPLAGLMPGEEGYELLDSPHTTLMPSPASSTPTSPTA